MRIELPFVAAFFVLVATGPSPADEGQTSSAATIHYRPEGMLFWDSWYLVRDGKAHVFHLQVKRPGSARPNEDDASIGHAVSEDLLHWKELPVALRRGPAGSCDAGPLYTGSTVWHDGTWYLFYCGNGPNPKSPWVETICLATSKDGVTFTKHPGNPIIKADGVKWDAMDARDIMVRLNPSGRGWIGMVVMRLKGKDRMDSIRWVHYRSTDLVHWEMDQVAFAPSGRYWITEVPDFFPLGDRWCLIGLNGDGTGSWSDPGIKMGTLVGQADRPEGPYTEVKDNLLLKSNDFQGFSARTLLFNGERLMLYSRNEGLNGKVQFGRLSWPVKLVPRSGGGLRPMYWHGCDRAFKAARKLPPATLRAGKDWVVEDLGAPAGDQTFMVTGRIGLITAQAGGLALSSVGASKESGRLPEDLALLDAQSRTVKVTYPSGGQKIQWPLAQGGSYLIRLVVVDEMVEFYVDDELVINCFTGTLMKQGIRLFASGGEARFSELQYFGGTRTCK